NIPSGLSLNSTRRCPMKKIIPFILLTLSTLAPATPVDGKFKIHLYFDDTAPYIDEVTLHTETSGKVTGTMHVPSDFDAVVENFSITGNHFSFEYVVPKAPHQGHPVSFRARYTGDFFDDTHTRMAG